MRQGATWCRQEGHRLRHSHCHFHNLSLKRTPKNTVSPSISSSRSFLLPNGAVEGRALARTLGRLVLPSFDIASSLPILKSHVAFPPEPIGIRPNGRVAVEISGPYVLVDDSTCFLLTQPSYVVVSHSRVGSNIPICSAAVASHQVYPRGPPSNRCEPRKVNGHRDWFILIPFRARTSGEWLLAPAADRALACAMITDTVSSAALRTFCSEGGCCHVSSGRT